MIQVAAAVIENDKGQILIARRKKGKAQEGMWEFPGGKLEPDETAEQCLVRELQEEMKIRIEPYQYLGANDHIYGSTRIRLIAYKAKYMSGDFILSDHDAYRWEYPRNFGQYTFAPADIKFVELLMG